MKRIDFLAWLSALSALAAAGAPATADADPRACGTLAAQAANQAQLDPTDTLLVGRIVFVTFPDSRSDALPAYADSMAAELADYLAAQSRGRWRTDIRVVKRSDDSTRAWLAPQPAATYSGKPSSGYVDANRDVCRAIAAAQSGVWSDVDQVWMVHDQCTFACTDNRTRQSCEDTCPYGGISTLGVGDPQVPGLTGGGTTQRVFVNAPDARNHQIQLSFAAHEFGHRIMSTPHTPGSDTPDPGFTNFGRYDVMRSGVHGAFAREEGLLPYAALHLARWGWLDRTLVSRDTIGLRVPDVSGPRGRLVEIATRSALQTFVVAHYAGSTPYDTRYGGSGLLIWHRSRVPSGTGESRWDVECAGGRFTNARPDPANGKDALEVEKFALGSPNDLFAPRGGVSFGAWTNPSSRLHERDDAYAPETIWSGVSLENVRLDPSTGDLLVDVWVTPAQPLLAPTEGERFGAAQAVPIRWQPRASAGIVDVDLEASLDDGTTWFSIAERQPNSGGWDWLPVTSAERARVRVRSRDSTGTIGVSTSRPFAIGDAPPSPPSALSFARPAPNPAAARVRFAFELPAAAHVRIELRDAAGRFVRTLADGNYRAGSASVEWDGHDAAGSVAPPGLYFARLSAGGAHLTRRVVRLGRN